MLLPDFDVYAADAHKLSKQGRLSCGVMVLVKKTLTPFVERIDTDVENIVTVKLKKELLKSIKDVILVACYLPPHDSKFWNNSQSGYGFESIEKCLLDVYLKCTDSYFILCGDFNARTGTRNGNDVDDFDVLSTPADDAFPRSSQDKGANLFGDQLIEFCSMLDCVILNGLKEKMFDDSCTFISTAGSSLVDYFIMSKDLFLLLNVCSLQVENKIESDHLPVVLNIKISHSFVGSQESDDHFEEASEKTVWNKTKEEEFFQCLNTDDVQSLIILARNFLKTDIDKAVDYFVQGICRASECMKKKVGLKNSRKKSAWYDNDCKEAKILVKKKLRVFRRTRNHNDRMEYVNANKTFKKLIRNKRKLFRQNQAAALASSSKNSSAFWTHVRHLMGDKKTDHSIKIELNTWYTHFQNLFNHDVAYNENVVQEDVPTDPDHVLNAIITIDEVLIAVRNLKTGKAGGLDGILSEMLKAGKHVTVSFLTDLFNAIFDQGRYPSQWAKAVIVPIFKKGAKDVADNYRGISLLSITSKCFTSILNRRLSNWLASESKIMENQAGFRKNYSTIDHVFTLHSIVQNCLSKKGRKLYVAFVDFKKAFDSVHHDKLLEALQHEGVSGKFFSIIKSMYESLRSCVRVGGKLTDFFGCPKGVRQGCVLSPTLFSVFINKVAQHISNTGRHGVQLMPGLMELFILLFADDITLIATTPTGLQNQLDCLKQCCDQLKLEVNIDKTKIIVFRKGGFLSKFEHWTFNGMKVEVVNEYCYLGFVFTTMLSHKIGTKHLVSKGKKAVFNLCRLQQQLKEINKEIFFKIFDSKVQSILLYASEIWGLCRLETLEKVHVLVCKRFLGVPIRTPNKMVYGELVRFPLYINSAVRAIKYWFKLIQMSHDRLPYQAYCMLLNMDKNGKDNWASQVRSMLSSCGFYFVWLQQGVGNINSFLKEFKNRLQDIYRQEWHSSIAERDRYEIYRTFKTEFTAEPYIIDIDVYCFRVAISQLRFGVLPINNNMQRYSDNIMLKYCPFCSNVVENEEHFLYKCPLYADLRERFLYNRPQSVNNLLRWKDLINIRALGKFVYYSFRRRQELLEATT